MTENLALNESDKTCVNGYSYDPNKNSCTMEWVLVNNCRHGYSRIDCTPDEPESICYEVGQFVHKAMVNRYGRNYCVPAGAT
ncbi:MAG: hypothetical protein OXD01_07600 [Gammaproteobacteria bacterium]|nr:hypothetical protein [Gammaproteobacteria bacterium]